MVTQASGRRAVVSVNATSYHLAPPPNLHSYLQGVDVVEVDGHHMELGLAAVRAAGELGKLTVLDGGSWKAGTDDLLPLLDVVVCSDDFVPPGVSGHEQVGEFLLDRGVTSVAMTRGPDPILWWTRSGERGTVEVPPVAVVDTLGAGDIFHGALTHALATRTFAGDAIDAAAFSHALARASSVASRSCSSFGTREWMKQID
jgi:sugar/nucleoside kinase (ribokinase family)